ncbi:MAG TPA: acyl-CoA dehydrogenase family protein [Gaiellaceae bacterium]|jgi:alkylation response protein AidB-like acyl-CoA dehydrogenase|nr:acyl-CoA dehydrogenase family protein [Gaiellaceae bacterium]
MTGALSGLGRSGPPALAASLDAVAGLPAPEALARLVAVGALDVPFPAKGETGARFAALEQLGRFELSLARLAEGHLDALAILDEGGHEPPEGLLGVWAAGPVDTLRARRSATGWRLDGLRRWCSGAPDLTHALVRAATDSDERLFLVPLGSEGFAPVEGSWPAIGMAESATLDVQFDGVLLDRDAEVGPAGFYLERPGFWCGGAGVAAVWLGGAQAVAALLARRAGDDPHRLAHLGWVTARVAVLEAFLHSVADRIDAADPSPVAIERLARILRAEVAEAAAGILERTGRATGAGPLSHDRDHARRVVDLELYIRQSHAEADLEAIGRLELALAARSSAR